jgi:hypothetical protein
MMEGWAKMCMMKSEKSAGESKDSHWLKILGMAFWDPQWTLSCGSEIFLELHYGTN